MTNEIEELEALLEKATPGPWEAWGGKPSHDNVSYAGLGDPTDWPVCSPDKYKAEGWSGFPDRSVDRVATAYSTADQEFICATRNLLPTLLQSLKDKDAEIERLREAITSIGSHPDIDMYGSPALKNFIKRHTND